MYKATKIIRLGDTKNIEKFTKICSQNLRLLNAALKNANDIGEKTKLQTALGKMLGYRTFLKGLQIRGAGVKECQSDRIRWHDIQSAFQSRIRTGCITNLRHVDPRIFLEDAKSMRVRRLKNELRKTAFLKVNTAFCGRFTKSDGEEDFKYINTKNRTISRDTDLGVWYNEHVAGIILRELEEFQERDSGWALSTIVDLMINVNRYNPQRVGSYLPPPPVIIRKKACINVRNTDDACFAWAVVSALYPAEHGAHPDRTSSYPHFEDVLNLAEITFPIQRNAISKFEKNNNISVNVYFLEKNLLVVPNRLTKEKKNRHVNLLLIQNKTDPQKYHYVWIKDLSRLVSRQLDIHDHKKFFCDRCLHYFHSEARLRVHSNECVQPTRDPKKTHQHTPYSVGYYFKCSYDDSLSFYRSYRGKDCAVWLVCELQSLAEDVETAYKCPIPMDKLTPVQYRQYATSPTCHICEKPLGAERVRDHCHFTGKYRGAAHSQCNLEYLDTKTIPVVFHNLSGYDGHLLVEELAKSGKLRVIPNNTERYTAMTHTTEDNEIKFKFIESFRFMASSIDKLASYLEEHPVLVSNFNRDVGLLKRTGVFPYGYVDNLKKLDELHLPPIEAFHNDLTNTDICEEDYKYAQKVWREFQCRNLGEYSDLYMKTDVLLLAEIFENFRQNCLKNYGLDAAHYYTAPGLSWDAMLKYTGVELDTLQDVDLLMFLERGIRGGMTQCSARHARANNKYMPDYNPSLPSTYLMYYDINAMYSWAMSQYLPSGGLKWVEDVDNFNLNIPDDSPTGYILEVDLQYPQGIHDRQSDLPMAPEKRKPPGSREEKLLATLYNKERYVVHYRNLKQYLCEGLLVTRIHRVLQFNQSDWLKPYIDLNTRLRQRAKNEFEKNLFKLMNNAIFGKTMENVRLRRDIKIVSKWDGRYGAEALISKPNFKNSTIFNENLVRVELYRNEVIFDKPIYVGMSILDISKTVLYEFHYNYMKNFYGGRCKVCYTDSLIYAIETVDVYEDMKTNITRFDTSDYPENNIYGIPRVNKKVPGLMKDEGAGKLLLEFVGLRAKMYACRFQDSNIKKAKGVKTYVVKQEITFDDYLRCLERDSEMVHDQRGIRSFHHQLYTTVQTKTSLSPYDNKRFRVPGFTDTLPWGHYSVPVNPHH
ncbi:hypothetical protein Trydic_g14174 [Trypoxylus dichotomus]